MHPASSRVVLAVASMAGVLLTGCAAPTTASDAGKPAGGASITVTDDTFHGTLLEPSQPRPDLVLPTTAGEPFDLGDRPDDEVTVLFFGYTHCPDVCPTTMADLAQAQDRLPAAVRDRVQVVFVTEDPARDTPELLREWLDRFDPDFVGLSGGEEATAAALRALYLPESEKVAAPSTDVVHPHEAGGHGHEDYGVDHAGIVYAWGPGGRSVIYTGGTTPAQYAEDLTRLAAAD